MPWDAGVADFYRWFASFQARGESSCYQEWANGVAGDPALIDLIGNLPERKRQPNLVFAAARYAGIRPGPFARFRKDLLAAWPVVRTIIMSKRTQTNEPGRCAVLLPFLAALPQPLAPLEVGASAGLCLYPDRFSYQYGDRRRLDPETGPSPALLSCTITGSIPPPTELPTVV